MTTYNFVTRNCSNCSHSNTVQILTSTNAMGSYDLDLRPPPMQRFTMDSWIEICENCGFVWHDLGDQKIDKNIIQDVMTSEQWIYLSSKEFILSLNFEKYALMCIALAGAKEEALAYKYAAWAADDEFNEVKATVYRLKAVNAFCLSLIHI